MTEIITNPAGGKQSRLEGRMTEVPPIALLEVSKVMGEGSIIYPREEDGTPNWHKIDWTSNLDHCLEHAANACAARNLPMLLNKNNFILEELSHCAARAMMALEMFIKENDNVQ